MKLIFKISLRNLFRQKQRNILLGIGIAFGMAVLIISNGFSSGLSDILLNRMLKTMTGHFSVTVQEKPETRSRSIIRDKDHITQIINETVQGDVSISEGITSMGGSGGGMGSGPGSMNQALGNGATAITLIIGVNKAEFMEQTYQVLSGRIEDIWENSNNVENPILIYDTLAENLNVQFNDTIQIRFNTVYGQVQAARFTVVCVLKSNNPFMSIATFTSQETLKPLTGLEPQETGSLSIVINNLDNPLKVIQQANLLHQALRPGAAGFMGQVTSEATTANAMVLGINSEEDQQKAFAEKIRLASGVVAELWTADTDAIISQRMANRLGIGVGDRLSLTYETKFAGTSEPLEARVKGIFVPDDMLTEEMVVLAPDRLYQSFIPVLPMRQPDIDNESELFTYLMPEWQLLDISANSEEMRKKFSDLRDEGWQGRIVDVATMYAMASQIIQMESVFKMVTLVAVLVLFFIILIGVVNTLRMTIRERTREIGTIRAIGMQRNTVRWSFLLEVTLLAFFASIVGTIFAFIVIKALSLITFTPEGMFSIFLVDNHLHFLPTVSDIITNLVIIVAITAITAILPANRASKLAVADALRHVE